MTVDILIDPSKVLFIAGPTASGKSSLAIRLAAEFGGEIVSCDSVQVYRSMDIGSAKPTLAEQRDVKHHLIDIFDPNEQGDVSRYMKLARKAISDIQNRDLLPIVVGGTGLYLTSLLHGLVEMPEVDAKLRAELNSYDDQKLRALLLERDPDSLRSIHQNDRVRIIRALENSILGGEQQSTILSRHKFDQKSLTPIIIVPLYFRDQLHLRIDWRVKEMMQNGLCNECQKLYERWGADAPALKSIGYREYAEVFSGQNTIERYQQLVIEHTRQLAKRQLTYWKNEPAKRGWDIVPGEDRDGILIGAGESATRRKGSEVKPIKALNLSYEVLREELLGQLDISRCTPKVMFINGMAL